MNDQYMCKYINHFVGRNLITMMVLKQGSSTEKSTDRSSKVKNMSMCLDYDVSIFFFFK